MNRKNVFIAMMVTVVLASCTKDVVNKDDEFDLKASKMEQIGGLFDAIARQPEMADYFIKTEGNSYSDISELLPISDKAIAQRGQARGYAFGELFAGIARQPEAFGILDSVATRFLGKYDKKNISDELLEITKTCAMTELLDAIARQPEVDSLFNVVCKRYLNFELSSLPE